MKPFLILFLIFFFQVNIQAQETIAKYKFQEAEKAFNEGRYAETLQNLEEVDRMLGRPTPATLYLKIEARDRIIGNDPLGKLGELAQLQEDYLYYLKNYENSDESKYIDIYKISERYQTLKLEPELVRMAASGDAKACLDLGEKCESIGLDDYAIKFYKRSADQSYLPAIIKLSYAYWYGWATQRDKKKALPYLKQAADGGDWHANICMAELSGLDSLQFKKYGEKGFVLTRNEAEKGNADAVFYMGYLYQLGIGVMQNDEKAVEWYGKVDGNGTFLEEAVLRRSRLKGKFALIQKGDELLAAGNYAGAIENYEKANDKLGLRKKLGTAYQKLGEEYLEKREYSLAVKKLKAACEFSWEDDLCWERFKEVEKMAKEEEAYADAKISNECDKYEGYASKYPQGKYIQQVNEYLEQAYPRMGEFRFSMGQYQKAKESYQKYLNCFPNGALVEEMNKKIKLCDKKLK